MIAKHRAIEIAERAKAGLADIYGPRLRGVYLFGSQARSEAHEDSDIDIAVILDEVEDVGEEIERTGLLFSALGLEANAVVSRVFVRERDFESGRLPLHRNVKSEGLRV